MRVAASLPAHPRTPFSPTVGSSPFCWPTACNYYNPQHRRQRVFVVCTICLCLPACAQLAEKRDAAEREKAEAAEFLELERQRALELKERDARERAAHAARVTLQKEQRQAQVRDGAVGAAGGWKEMCRGGGGLSVHRWVRLCLGTRFGHVSWFPPPDCGEGSPARRP